MISPISRIFRNPFLFHRYPTRLCYLMESDKEYHIGIAPGEIPELVLLPGDPDRSKKIAEEFFEKVKKRGDVIIISTAVVRELLYNLGEDFMLFKEFIKKNMNRIIIRPAELDYDFARILETKDAFRIGFYDYLHIAIAKRLKVILVTRDKELIRIAREHISVFKPEDLFK